MAPQFSIETLSEEVFEQTYSGLCRYEDEYIYFDKSNDPINHNGLIEENESNPTLNNFVLGNYVRRSLEDIMSKLEEDHFVLYIENIHNELILKNYGFNDYDVLKKLQKKYSKKGKAFFDPCNDKDRIPNIL